LIDKLQAIVVEINGPNGYKEVAISEIDFERAACLRDLANSIEMYLSFLEEYKPKQYATVQEILDILEHNSLELYGILCLSPDEAQLSYKLNSDVPMVSVAFRKGTTKSVPKEIRWELADKILLVRLEMTLDYQDYRPQ
jgi:hypothetical protein